MGGRECLRELCPAIGRSVILHDDVRANAATARLEPLYLELNGCAVRRLVVHPTDDRIAGASHNVSGTLGDRVARAACRGVFSCITAAVSRAVAAGELAVARPAIWPAVAIIVALEVAVLEQVCDQHSGFCDRPARSPGAWCDAKATHRLIGCCGCPRIIVVREA